MVWARLDDNFPDHPKVLPLSDGAFRVHVTAICYSQRTNTRGMVSRLALPLLRAKPTHVRELVEQGLWEPSGGGWEIHDFAVYNPPRDTEIPEYLREVRAQAGRRGGQRSGESRRSKIEANDEANEEAKTKHFASKQTKPRPVPSRPLPPHDTVVSSSPDAADTPVAVREFRDTVLSKLPGKNQRDPLTWDETESLARDYAFRPGAMTELAVAIDDCRRERELPFPSNLRKHLPELPSKVIQHPAANGNGPVQHDFGPAPAGYDDD